jgi:hypothetical protein
VRGPGRSRLKTLIKKVDPKATPDFDRFRADKQEAGNAAYSTLTVAGVVAPARFQAQRRFGEMMGERFTKDRDNEVSSLPRRRLPDNSGPGPACQGARRGAGKDRGA